MIVVFQPHSQGLSIPEIGDRGTGSEIGCFQWYLLHVSMPVRVWFRVRPGLPWKSVYTYLLERLYEG